jgi:hypothetical protein
MDETKILGNTNQEREEINAVPLWVALRYFFMLFFNLARYRSPAKALEASDRYIREEDR